MPSSQNRLAVQLSNYGLKYDDIRNEADADIEAAIAVRILFTCATTLWFPLHIIPLVLRRV